MEGEYNIKKYILGEQLGKGTFGYVYDAKFNPDYQDLFQPDILTTTAIIQNTNNVGATDKMEDTTQNKEDTQEVADTSTLLLEKKDVNLKCKMAIKITKNEPRFIKAALREITFLEELNVNNRNQAPIIKLLDSYLDNEIPCLVFEKMDINLYNFYKDNHINYSMAMSIFYKTTLALEYIHGRNIIHMDLKPENIMLDFKGRDLKIIDFGSACRNYTKHKYFYVQSRYYRAPEVVFKLKITPAVDIWSLGCIVFEILFQKPLFPARESNYELIYLFSISLGVPLDLDSDFNKYFFSPIFKKQYMWNRNFKKYELKYKQINDMPIDKFGLEKRLKRKLVMEYPGIYTNKLMAVLLKILTYNYFQRLSASQILEYGYLVDNF